MATTKTKTKHTPGPWHVREGKYGNVLVEHDTKPDGSSTWVLAHLDAQQYEDRFMPIGSQMANARLIAQAPAMYELLRQVAARDDRGDRDAARAVLAAVEGEG